MKGKHKFSATPTATTIAAAVTAAASLGLGLAGTTAAASADTIQLTGTIRDFKASHPDMESAEHMGGYGVVHDMVANHLDAHHKPIYNSHRPRKDVMYSEHSFSQWYRDVPGVNISMPYTITLDNHRDQEGGLYDFTVDRSVKIDGKPQYFFPIDGRGWADTARDANGDMRNFYFTYEIHTKFTYTDPAKRDQAMVFYFFGDDDIWVFINDRLAVDLGGVHQQSGMSINLDRDAQQLGLEPGGTYHLDFFYAERHTTQSNFRMQTTIKLKDVPPTSISPLYD